MNKNEFLVKTPKHNLVKVISHENGGYVADDENIDEEEQEILAIPKADTIIDPRTVMVHVKYASITSRAMMTTFRLEHITHKAISASFVFIVTQVETPEYRYLSRISRHCLEERPEQHKE